MSAPFAKPALQVSQDLASEQVAQPAGQALHAVLSAERKNPLLHLLHKV
jgi:hypothetical protein